VCALIFQTQQKIRNMHGLYAFVVASRKFICPQNILGIVISYPQQFTVFPFLCFRLLYAFRNLNIQSVFLFRCDKVNFSVSNLADAYVISAPLQFQIHNIFQHRRHAVRCIPKNSVSKRGICQVEFLLRF